MPRLIDVSYLTPLPPAVSLQVGDLLLFRATGGMVIAGNAIEALGAFMAAALAPDGSVLAAMGGPDAVVFAARAPGRARIEVMLGDPWQEPRRSARIDLMVEA